MGKLIDQQVAIDSVLKESNTDGAYGYMDTKSIIDLLNDLPSAQPEIILCNECMHNGSFDTDCPIDWAGKKYCSFAEGLTDA